MKKLLALTLALLMLTAALPALAETAGPVLVPAELPGLPDGYYAHLGNGRVLVMYDGADSFELYDGARHVAIYDLATHQLQPLHALEEDRYGWMQLMTAGLAELGESTTPEELMRLLGNIPMDNLLPLALSYTSWMVKPPVAQLVTFWDGYVLDPVTGLVRPGSAWPDPSQLVFWGENRLTRTQEDGMIHLTLSAPDGSLIRAADVPVGSEWTYVDGGRDMTDGVLYTLLSDEIDGIARKLAFIWVDSDLTAHTIDLGTWHNNTLEINYAPLYSAAAGKLLIQADGAAMGKNVKTRDAETGRVTFSKEPYGPWLEGLMLVDVATGEVQRIGEELYVAVPLGMSADGSHALVYDHNGSLHRLDMATGALTQTMSADEVDALFDQVLPAPFRFVASLGNFGINFPWDGGDYAVYSNVIFRVQYDD